VRTLEKPIRYARRMLKLRRKHAKYQWYARTKILTQLAK
jgi:hypothetical protein